jgi:transposase
MKKYTKKEFEIQYPNDEVCLHKIFTVRFGHFKDCTECKKSFDYKRLSYKSKVKGAQKKAYRCSHCGNQIYPLANTIFEKTTTPLTSWFYALYLLTTTRNGLAAKEIGRQVDVCYKTALRIAHQLKKLMANKTQPVLSGVVEVDETFMGGLERNKHKHKRTKGHAYVGKIFEFGMLQNGGFVIAQIVDKIDWDTLRPIIKEKIEENSTVVTNGFLAYKDLPKHNFNHKVISHTAHEYVKDGFHTNTLEGFWSQLKRMIKGTHMHVSKKHLQKYIDECATRYMLRNEGNMFDIILKQVA